MAPKHPEPVLASAALLAALLAATGMTGPSRADEPPAAAPVDYAW
ncbi:hypothetical protein ACF1G0_05780 [Streptomyces sp. NPDC013953]